MKKTKITLYEEDKKEEASMRCSLLHGSWDQILRRRPSVCLSVRPSVTPFWLCSHHRIIMKFSGVITSDRSDVHAKGQGQRSKVKVTEVTTQLNRFRTVTPVWIHIWWWNDAYSLIMLRRCALLFLAATKQLYKWYFPSVCPSVCLSVCPSVRPSVTPFWLCSHHRIIMKFSGVITND